MKLKKWLLIGSGLGILMVMYTNSTSYSPRLSESQIIAEFDRFHHRDVTGHYGRSPAAQSAIKDHKVNIVNHLSTRIRAENCGELYRKTPQMPSSNYVLHPPQSNNAQVKFCLSIAEISNVIMR